MAKFFITPIALVYSSGNCYVTIAALIVISQSYYSLLSWGLGRTSTMSCLLQNGHICHYYKMGLLLHFGHLRLLQNGSFFITKWAHITKWVIITKWALTWPPYLCVSYFECTEQMVGTIMRPTNHETSYLEL